MTDLDITSGLVKNVSITKPSVSVLVVGAQPNTQLQISMSQTQDLEIESNQQSLVEIISPPSPMIDISLDVNICTGIDDYVDISARDPLNEDIVYAGKSESPDNTSTATWQIYRLDVSNDEKTFADGDINYDNVWDDYLTLTYLPIT